MSRFYSELLIFCNLSFPGESATHYLVKNTVRTFKELGVRVHFDLELCDYSIRITFLLRCCAMLCAGSEGAKREQGDHTGAEQHFSTSGQS